MKIRKIINSKLSYAIYIVLVAFMFTSCSYSQNMEIEFGRLSHPIIIVGVSEHGSVTLCDSENKYMILSSGYAFTGSIADSYVKGDTLICGNCN